MTVLKALNASVATLSETNLNWKMSGVYDAVKQKLNKVWRRNKLVVSNCPERTKMRYQPGGTATLVTSLACHRVCESGDDKYG
eukprot:13983938-Ditylum_brightwellii.AAC.1